MKKVFITAPVSVAGRHYQPDPFNSVKIEDSDALFLLRRKKAVEDTSKPASKKKADK